MSNFKDIPHPNWDEMIDCWLGNIPAGLTPPSVNVEELVRLSGHKLEDKQPIQLIGGVRERTFGDIILLRDKALYCYRICKTLNDAGHSTWTSLAMYDACFFAAKAMMFLMGFRDVGASSNFYVSIFHKEFKKHQMIFDGHFIYLFKERLTHNSLWEIFNRLVNTIRGQKPIVSSIKSLRQNDYGQFTKERNNLIYRSEVWSRSDDINISDLFYDVAYLGNHQFLRTNGEVEAEYIDKYYRSAHSIINLVDDLLGDIGRNAPAIREHISNYPGLAPVNSMKLV